MITLIGILAGLFVFTLFAPNRVRKGEASRRIAEMYSLDTARTLSELNPGSLEYKLLSSGVRVQPVTFRLLTAAGGCSGMCGCLAAAAWAAGPGAGCAGWLLAVRLVV